MCTGVPHSAGESSSSNDSRERSGSVTPNPIGWNRNSMQQPICCLCRMSLSASGSPHRVIGNGGGSGCVVHWPTLFSDYSSFERFLDENGVSVLGPPLFEQTFDSYLSPSLRLDNETSHRTDPLPQLSLVIPAPIIAGDSGLSSGRQHSPRYYLSKEVNSARYAVDATRAMARLSYHSGAEITREHSVVDPNISISTDPQVLFVGDQLGIDRLDEFPPLTRPLCTRVQGVSSLLTAPRKTRAADMPPTSTPQKTVVGTAPASTAFIPRYMSRQQALSDTSASDIVDNFTPTKTPVKPLLSIETGPPPGILSFAGPSQLVTKVRSLNPLFIESANDSDQSSLYKFDFMAQYRDSQVDDRSVANPEFSRTGRQASQAASEREIMSWFDAAASHSTCSLHAVDSYMDVEQATSTTSVPVTRSLDDTTADISEFPLLSTVTNIDEKQKRTHSEEEEEEDSEDAIGWADVEDGEEENDVESVKQGALEQTPEASSASTLRNTTSRPELQPDDAEGEWVTKVKSRRGRLADSFQRSAASLLRNCPSKRSKKNKRIKTVLTFVSTCATGNALSRNRVQQKVMSYSDAVAKAAPCVVRPSLTALCVPGAHQKHSQKQSVRSVEGSSSLTGTQARRIASKAYWVKKLASTSKPRASFRHTIQLPQCTTRALPISKVKRMVLLYHISTSSEHETSLMSEAMATGNKYYFELHGIAIMPNNVRLTALSSSCSRAPAKAVSTSCPHTLFVADSQSDCIKTFDMASMLFHITCLR